MAEESKKIVVNGRKHTYDPDHPLWAVVMHLAEAIKAINDPKANAVLKKIGLQLFDNKGQSVSDFTK
jgi:hypothetical protein